MNYAMEYIPTRRERLGWRFFPAKHCDIPDKPGWRDGVITRTTADLSFIDRLRVLVSGKIEVISKTATENAVGEHSTNATFTVRPPGWLSR